VRENSLKLAMRGVEVWATATRRRFLPPMRPIAAAEDIHAEGEVTKLTAKKSGAHSA
jgi:hypothetical protein